MSNLCPGSGRSIPANTLVSECRCEVCHQLVKPSWNHNFQSYNIYVTEAHNAPEPFLAESPWISDDT